MATPTRTSVVRVQHEATGKWYLQGKEKITPERTNVFGNGEGRPVASARNGQIVYEAEVEYAFATRADDDATDSGEVFRGRLWMWSNQPDGAKAEMLMNWQDFSGDDPPGAEYGWDHLLSAAVERLRRARDDRSPLPPALVGTP